MNISEVLPSVSTIDIDLIHTINDYSLAKALNYDTEVKPFSHLKELNLSYLREHKCQITEASEGCYKAKFFDRTIPMHRVKAMLEASNNIIVEYAEDLENNELLDKTDVPIWTINREGDYYTITRYAGKGN
ncbi:hypothetical protein ThvES_00020050 [Thiovulum sp. ES]|nr:hypothetical protein ThvES_00020050 [Thiovulum sp. ES]